MIFILFVPLSRVLYILYSLFFVCFLFLLLSATVICYAMIVFFSREIQVSCFLFNLFIYYFVIKTFFDFLQKKLCSYPIWQKTKKLNKKKIIINFVKMWLRCNEGLFFYFSNSKGVSDVQFIYIYILYKRVHMFFFLNLKSHLFNTQNE